jgi:uncharacterized membrane protein YqjE
MKRMTRDAIHPSKPGTFAHVTGLFSSSLKYLKAHAELFAIEAKEAGINYGIAAGLAVGGLVAVVLGYIMLVITIVFALSLLFGGGNAWIWVMGGAALVHIGAAVALVLVAKNRLKTAAFPETMEELKRDQSWMTQLKNSN